MPRGRMRASDGIADPHCVQKAAGGVDRWQVGHLISPGFGVAISAALCLPRPALARGHGSLRLPNDDAHLRHRDELLRQDDARPSDLGAVWAAACRARRAVLGAELDAGARCDVPGTSGGGPCRRSLGAGWRIREAPRSHLGTGRAGDLAGLSDARHPRSMGRQDAQATSLARGVLAGNGQSRDGPERAAKRRPPVVDPSDPSWASATQRTQDQAPPHDSRPADAISGPDGTVARRPRAIPGRLITRRGASTRSRRQTARASRSAAAP